MKTTTEKHNNQNEELYSVMQWIHHTNTFMPKAQKTLLQKKEKIVRVRGLENVM